MELELQKLSEIVVTIANRELLPRFARGASINFRDKDDGSVVTDADMAVQEYLQDALKSVWPDYGFLSEEMNRIEQQRLLKVRNQGLWCVDPIDGTSNFFAGLPFFSVSVALWQDGQPKWALVYDPVRQECFTAARNRGVWLNGQALGAVGEPPGSLDPCVAVVDFKRLEQKYAVKLATKPPYRSQRNLGSCALEWCWLAAGRFHLYLHGGQKLWDYAAGYLILREAGGEAETLGGEPVIGRDLHPRSVVAARNASLHRQWAGWLTSIK